MAQYKYIWFDELTLISTVVCMQNAFNHTWRKKTIFNSYQRVRKDVWFSDVMIYGDFSVAKEKLSSFVGYKKSNDSQEIHKTALQSTKHEVL